MKLTLHLKRSYPEASLQAAGEIRRFRAPLFDLAPRRVWLFSLQRLPQGLPFSDQEISALDILSVPLFLALRRGVINPCAAMWSPDFPRRLKRRRRNRL